MGFVDIGVILTRMLRQGHWSVFVLFFLFETEKRGQLTRARQLVHISVIAQAAEVKPQFPTCFAEASEFRSYVLILWCTLVSIVSKIISISLLSPNFTAIQVYPLKALVA